MPIGKERRPYDETVDDLLLDIQQRTLEFQTYIPVIGERWDNIAASSDVFSNPYSIEILKRFNPRFRNRRKLGPDTPIRIPLFKVKEFLNINSLPPWDPRRARVINQ